LKNSTLRLLDAIVTLTPSYLARARDNGVTQAELIETITHLAFYAGWPSGLRRFP
jgi:alkylhydroperoxidase/carboxymuconolactone decarboxylase family protein YurZ